jgi:hypothetical protein
MSVVAGANPALYWRTGALQALLKRWRLGCSRGGRGRRGKKKRKRKEGKK